MTLISPVLNLFSLPEATSQTAGKYEQYSSQLTTQSPNATSTCSCKSIWVYQRDYHQTVAVTASHHASYLPLLTSDGANKMTEAEPFLTMDKVKQPEKAFACGNRIAGADSHSVCASCLRLQHAQAVSASSAKCVYTPKAIFFFCAVKLHRKSMAWCEIAFGGTNFRNATDCPKLWLEEAIFASITSLHKFKRLNFSKIFSSRQPIWVKGLSKMEYHLPETDGQALCSHPTNPSTNPNQQVVKRQPQAALKMVNSPALCQSWRSYTGWGT